MRTKPTFQRSASSHRSAFSLVEMMAAMTVLSILVVGVGSTLVIASRAVDDGTAVNAQIPEARDVGDLIMADISDAITITERTATAITFTVPDRDNNGDDETLRYEWDGKPGGIVTRQYNDGTVVTIAEDVHRFDLTYLTRTVKPPPQACCFVDGTCADESPDDCTSNGGLAKGKNTVCSESDCIGACCMESGECMDTTELACTSKVRDRYRGDGSRCADVSCPVGVKVLFVVVDDSSLTNQELARKNSMIAWNFDVALIQADTSQAAFDTAFVGADAAYVSEEISSTDVNTKLTDATIGVVNGEMALTDELGISSSSDTANGTDITITNSTHYITEPFSTGTLTIESSTQKNVILTGTLAPGLTVLAELSGDACLSVLEKGDELYDGSTAAGRRVQLPWGGDSFDVQSLNDDGESILRRSLVWAGGKEGELAPVCGDTVCNGGEDPCSCAQDCGTQTLIEQASFNCADGIDNDCDGTTDCADTECSADTSCK